SQGLLYNCRLSSSQRQKSHHYPRAAIIQSGATSMHFVVKVFSEIIIKSTPVRKRFIKQLRDNLRLLLGNIGVDIDVQRDWEKIEIRCADASPEVTAKVAEVLAHTPGIANFALIHDY